MNILLVVHPFCKGSGAVSTADNVPRLHLEPGQNVEKLIWCKWTKLIVLNLSLDKLLVGCVSHLSLAGRSRAGAQEGHLLCLDDALRRTWGTIIAVPRSLHTLLLILHSSFLHISPAQLHSLPSLPKLRAFVRSQQHRMQPERKCTTQIPTLSWQLSLLPVRDDHTTPLIQSASAFSPWKIIEKTRPCDTTIPLRACNKSN